MPKVLLVEDDNNLREIFEMRLQAEGYKTISASDGEEALVVAVKEKPDLVIADVMMPKLSGFEMVESMRAAPELANVKVIMMTALGQAEDRVRGEKLGVVKYLVKSQVTLEDFVRVVREVLPPNQDSSGAQDTAAQPGDLAKTETENNNKQESEQTMQDDNMPTNPPTPAEPQTGPSEPTDSGMPPADTSDPAVNPISSTPPVDGVGGSDPQTTAQEETAVNDQINDFASDPNAGAAPSTPPADDSTPTPADPAVPEPPAPTDPTTPPAPEGGDSQTPPVPTNPA